MTSSNRQAIVVETNDEILTAIISRLREERIQANAFRNAADAIDFSRSGHIVDLLITNVKLPDMNVAKFCRILRSPDCPAMNYVPILTYSEAGFSDDMANSATEAGANAFLAPPFDPDRLRSAVRNLLDGKQPSIPCEVLIIESNSMFRRELSAALYTRDFVVHEASSILKAEALMQKRKPQIIVLNLSLDSKLAFSVSRLTDDLSPKLIGMGDPQSFPDPLDAMQPGPNIFVRLPVIPLYIVELCERVRKEILLVSLLDRAERKNQLLQEDTEHYRQLFNRMADAFILCEIICDKDGKPYDARILDLNPAGEALFNLNREKLIDKAVSDIEAGLLLLPISLYATGVTGTVTQVSKYESRLGKHLEIVAYSPKPLQFAAIIRDVTKRKKAEDALAMEKERLLVTLQRLGEGVVTIDRSGTIQLFNNCAELLTGFREAEVIGKPFTEVLHLVRQIDSIPLIVVDRTLGKAESVSEEGVLISRDGTHLQVHINSAPVTDNLNVSAGAVIVIRDVTEHRRLQMERERSQRMDVMGLVAGGIAHDFNNHLMAIIGNLSLARSIFQSDVPSDLAELLQDAEDAALRSRSLTQQMLTFSKEGAPLKHAVRLKDVIKESVRFVLSGSRCTYSLVLPEDLWVGDVDPGQVSHIIQNIVINALQAMPNGGEVHITGENVKVDNDVNPHGLATGRYIKISIADTGGGIPKHIAERIFEPYFTTKKDGSGLGLATSFSIARKHGGHIAVESVVGHGTRFDVFLPAWEHPIAQVPTGQIQAIPEGGRILVMDDSESVHRLVSRMFRSIGYRVNSAWSGAEAVSLYENALNEGQPFDLAILDLTVPGQMGAKETIEALRAIDPSVKAVVSSGRTDDPVILNWKEFHFVGVLLKPFQIQELKDLLQRINTRMN